MAKTADYKNINARYIKRLLDNPAWKKIKLLKVTETHILELLEEFATFQDAAYNGAYESKSTLLDDFIEIAYLYKYQSVLANLQSAKDFKKILSDMHDAWAYARFLQFKVEHDTIIGVEAFKEPTNTTDPARFEVRIKIDNQITTRIQLRRFAQFVEFQDLLKFSPAEAMKDLIPIQTYCAVIAKNPQKVAIAKQIHDMIFPPPTARVINVKPGRQ